ncbi:MAG: hypothetical protein QXR65_02580 [Candidatus Bathyarchaeia archaeon]|nr:hypothetical protein [Candidatus Bathyarchaeota archaeon]
MNSVGKVASILLLSLVAVVAVYPALPMGQVDLEVEVEPLKEVPLMELKLGELYVHHYGARENNGRFTLIEDVAIKASSLNPETHRYVARIPYGSYDEIRMEFSEAKAHIGGETLELDVSRGIFEENLTLDLRGEAHLKVVLHIDEGKALANHTLSMDVEVISLK